METIGGFFGHSSYDVPVYTCFTWASCLVDVSDRHVLCPAQEEEQATCNNAHVTILQVPELNVQNGVLKSLSFLFEYIGEMGKDYIYAVTPLLEDALMDRDLVHRQTAASVVQHMSLGVAGACFT